MFSSASPHPRRATIVARSRCRSRCGRRRSELANPRLTRRSCIMNARLLALLFGSFLCCIGARLEATPPIEDKADLQPLQANCERLLQALEFLGAPLPDAATKSLKQLLASKDPKTSEQI